MSKKIILSALSIILIVFALVCLTYDFELIDYYSSNQIGEIALKRLTLRVATLLSSILLLLSFNFLMWFKNLFGIPLTPEQAAERKRIKQERRKARLQEKLNKLN